VESKPCTLELLGVHDKLVKSHSDAGVDLSRKSGLTIFVVVELEGKPIRGGTLERFYHPRKETENGNRLDACVTNFGEQIQKERISN